MMRFNYFTLTVVLGFVYVHAQMTMVCDYPQAVEANGQLTCIDNGVEMPNEVQDYIACCPEESLIDYEQCQCEYNALDDNCPSCLSEGHSLGVTCRQCCCFCAEATDEFQTCCQNGLTVCGAAPQQENGNLSAAVPSPTIPDVYQEGTILLYMCDANYGLNGSSRITCGSDGTWTELGTCEPLNG